MTYRKFIFQFYHLVGRIRQTDIMQQPAFPKTFCDFRSFENKEQMSKIGRLIKVTNLTSDRARFLKRINYQVYKLSQKSSQPLHSILSMHQQALVIIGGKHNSYKQITKGHQLTYCVCVQLSQLPTTVKFIPWITITDHEQSHSLLQSLQLPMPVQLC